MRIQGLIQSYYDSLSKKNTTWQNLWAEDGYFSDASQALSAKGKDAIIQSFTPFLTGVQKVEIKQMILQENTACVIVSYVYQNKKNETMYQDVAEVWEVADEKLEKLAIYFDLTAYRFFIKG